MRNSVKLMLVIMMLLSVTSFWKASAVQANTEPLMNVKLVEYLGNRDQVSFTVKGKYLADSEIDILLVEGKQYSIKKENTSVCLYEGTNKLACQTALSVKPLNASSYTYIEGMPYNGQFTFKVEDGFVRPTNSIYLEDYVKGVLPKEMWPKWPTEALKSQAAAIRSYAAYWKNRTLVDGVLNQVYGGYFWSPLFDGNKDYVNAVAAVDATKGQYITYNGRLIEGIYSASNGGHTESSTTHWGGNPGDFPFFAAKPDEFDGISDDVKWSVSFNKTQINTSGLDMKNPDAWWTQTKEKDAVLADTIKTTLMADYDKNNIKITAIPGMAFNDLTLGKRYTKAEISLEFFVKNEKDANGNLVLQKKVIKDVPPSKIKALFGTKIKNNYVKSNVEKDGVITISGAGFGHGVGLSQYGAHNRAQAGQSYAQILGFYYPGTALTTSYSKLADRNSLNATLRGWVMEGNNRYYYETVTGATFAGWKQLDGFWYYFEAGGKAKTGWNHSGGKWYFMHSTGKMLTGWIWDSGKWYYMNGDGAMRTGWLNENGKWYFLESGGAMKVDWKMVNNKWYYFHTSGVMQTGWVKSGAKWYYMDGSGAMQTGWIKAGGKWYYLYKDGSMASNTTIQGYRLGSDGAWIQ